jgi:hypothetical protein
MNISDVLGYVGSALMVAFAFTMKTELAIIGLAFLTAQAYDLKIWNLVALNLVSIVGFFSNFLK